MGTPRLLSWLAAGLVACVPAADAPSDPIEGGCEPALAVVTDIDETLTTLDSEYVQQLVDASHDPAMRPDADTLMQGYADRGYSIVYITARGEDAVLTDGRTAREATVDWLVDHGFPVDPQRVFLAEGLVAVGDDAVAYKAGVMDTLATELGVSFPYGYGNSETDIEAFRLGGVPDAHLFGVGEGSDTLQAQPLPDDAAYTAHLSWLDGVPDASCP